MHSSPAQPLDPASLAGLPMFEIPGMPGGSMGAFNLNDVLGNFVSRCLKFAAARFDGVVPEGGQAGPAEDALIQDLTALTSQYTANLSQLQFRKAFGDLRAIWVKGNEYLANAAPWTTIKTDPAAAAVSIRTGVNLIRLFALLSAPVIPATAQRMLHALNLAEAAHWPSQDITAELAALKPGHGERWKNRHG